MAFALAVTRRVLAAARGVLAAVRGVVAAVRGALAVTRGVLAAAIVAVAVLAPMAAQPQESPERAPEVGAAEADGNGSGVLDRFIEETRTLQADFGQELLDGEGNLVEAASGTFSLKRPNRFLWTYAEPFEQQVVADAENLWIHDVELAQVTVSPLEGAIASSPAMLLSGDGRVRDGFEITESSTDGEIVWISLAPREQGADFRSVQLGFDTGELFALVLVDALGQVTSIVFQNVALNGDIEDEFFQFEPPAGTDVIGEPVDNTR